MNMSEISQLEIDILFACYTFSDQYGEVDMPLVTQFGIDKLGVIIPNKQITLTQDHLNVLMDLKVVPDTRQLLTVEKLVLKPKIKARRIKNPKNPDM